MSKRAAGQLKRIAHEIRNMGIRSSDLHVVGPKIGNLLSANVARQFSTRGVFLGKPWKPLAQSTIKQKLSMGITTTPLVRTRKLKMSFVGRPMSVEKYGRRKFEFGSDLMLAVWQQKGTRRHGRRHIPPRVMLLVRRKDTEDIARIVARYIVRGRV